jgi:hypothetical protein
MKLAIADPPYLGRGHAIYGAAARKTFRAGSRSNGKAGRTGIPMQTDNHPRAATWDEPCTHEAMVKRLCAEYDGWAVALAHDNLAQYLRWVPDSIWIGIWVKPNGVPSGSRIWNNWEPVLVMPPDGRRRVNGPGMAVRGTHEASQPATFVGAKPASWTRWVLDMLGYDQDTDTVDDLFGGSGAVSREIQQMVMDVNP